MMIRYSKIASTGFVRDFQDSILKGRVLDIVIAIIAGISINRMVESLVKDILLPTIFTPILRNIGIKDLESLVIGTTKLGAFLANAISCLTAALILFLMIRVSTTFKRVEQRLDTADSQECPYCLSIIPIGAIKCSHCTSDLPSIM